MERIVVLISEKPFQIDAKTTLFQLRDARKPESNVIVLNGAVAHGDQTLHDGDSIVFIRRGEIPSQNEFEALMTARHTPGVHKVVKRATVGIAGLGGLGSTVAIALARLGVGALLLADFDIVEPSNLNRQQYFTDQIGMPKTEALAATLHRINPYLLYRSYPVRLTVENIPILYEKADVIVEALDREEEKAMLVETVMKQLPGACVVAASGMAGHDTANTINTKRIAKRFYLCGDTFSASEPGRGLMASRVGVVAHHQANAVLQFLMESPDL